MQMSPPANDTSPLCTRTLVETVGHWAAKQPDKLLFRFAGESGKIEDSYTYSQFDLATRRLAASLLKPHDSGGVGLVPGDHALLVYPPGLDFIVAFIACLRAGVVAVPVYPPRPGANKDLNMFLAVQRDCGAQVALTNSLYGWAKRAEAIKSRLLLGSKFKWPELRWKVTNTIAAGRSTTQPPPAPNMPSNSATAFLQYTSGSTSLPKGVVITHGALSHNCATISVALRASTNTVVVSWLPQYHDMGLIGSYLGPLYCGGSGVYISPISFIKSPSLWLQMASTHKATHLQAPNFAYQLVVRKWMELLKRDKTAKLDLSSVRHIFNAAEPIEPKALDSFNSTFASYGLSPSAMTPGYGLAEHTVYVCDGGKQRLVVDKKSIEKNESVLLFESKPETKESFVTSATTVVGCGYPHRIPASGIQVRIIHSDNRTVVPEMKVGEIWISSDSKANDYYGHEEKSKQELRAKIVPQPESNETEEVTNESTQQQYQVASSVYDEGGAYAHATEADDLSREWLRSGDLGFMYDGELFVCGRIKDLVIVRGRNHYPQDLEHTVEAVDALIRPGCSAAFAVPDQTSGAAVLVLVAEVRASYAADKSTSLEKLAYRIRTTLSAQHGVAAHHVVLIKEKTVPKTTSGKISRYRVRAAFLDKSLSQLYELDVAANARARNGGVDGFLDEDALAELQGQEDDVTDSNNTTKNGAKSSAKTNNKSSAINKKKSGGKTPEEEREALTVRLKDEVARLLDAEPAQMHPASPLSELGLDSMGLTQLRGILQNKFQVEVAEPEMFDEGMTLNKLVLRIQNKDSAGGGGGGGSVTDVPRSAAGAESTQLIASKKGCCNCF